MNERELMFFTRQLATMLKAGLPMARALDVLARGNRWSEPAKQLLAETRRDVEHGHLLSATLKKYPCQIDSLYLHLVRAGEHAGALDTILERLADYKERMLALKRRIQSAFYYPAFVVFVALAVVVLLLALSPVFHQDAAPAADLPFMARFVRSSLLFFSRYWFLALALPIGAVWGFFRAWKTSPDLRKRIDPLLLELPVFSKLVRQSALARWSRTLAMLYAAGMPLVDALEQVSAATGNHVYDEASRQIWRAVERGATLTAAVNASPRLFPVATQQMIATGETTGELDAMLDKLADYYEMEVATATTALTSLLTPIITVIMGILVGFFVIGMHSLFAAG